MKVKVVRARANNWYIVGEEYEVESKIMPGCAGDYYPLVDDENIGICVDHCEIIEEVPKFPFKVRCIDNNMSPFTIGEIYEVTGCYKDSDYLIYGLSGTWGKSRFEVVEEEAVVDEKDVKAEEPVATATIDSHYSFNYTLTETDRKNGTIKVDPYFVAKQWRLGSKDNTGVLFHCLKNISRYSDKNTKEREITALYLQVKRLAELEGVDLNK